MDDKLVSKDYRASTGKQTPVYFANIKLGSNQQFDFANTNPTLYMPVGTGIFEITPTVDAKSLVTAFTVSHIMFARHGVDANCCFRKRKKPANVEL